MTQEQELTLTPEQWVQVLKIQDDMVDSIKGNVKATVRTACELMDNGGIPKEKICYLVCQRHVELGYSEDYLRTFVPVEYKNQAQRDIRLTHDDDSSKNLLGRDYLDQHETPTTEILVHSDKDIQPIHKDPISNPIPKKISTYAQLLKSERDAAREELRAFRLRSGVTFVYECLKNQVPEPELGKKVKERFLKDKWYLKWLKEENRFNVRGKTPEQAYLEHLERTSDEQDRKEKQQVEKKSKSRSKSKSKSVEPKDISKNLLKEEKK